MTRERRQPELRFPFIALVRRDLIRSLRRTKSVVLLGLVLLACFLVVQQQLPNTDDPLGSIAAYGTGARDPFLRLFWAFVIAAFVLLPGMAAFNVTSEFEGETYEDLWLTLVSPFGLFLSKVLAALAYYLLVIVAAMPLLSVPLFVTGVDGTDVPFVGIALAVLAVLCTLAGIFWGMLLRRAILAVMPAYLTPVLLVGGATVIGVHLESYGEATAGIVSLGLILAFLLALATLSIILFAIFPSFPTPAPDKRVLDAAALEARRKRFPYYVVDPLRPRPPMPDGRNPLIVKELRTGLFARPTRAIRSFYVCAILFVVAAALMPFPSGSLGASSSGRTWVATATLFLQSGAILLSIPAQLIGAFAREGVGNNLDALRMTPLSPRDLMLGKLAGTMRLAAPLVYVVLLCGPFVTTMAVRTDADLLAIGRAFTTVLVCAWVAACASLYVSVWRLRTGQALLAAYGLVFMLFLVIYVTAGLLEVTICMQYYADYGFGSVRGLKAVGLVFYAPIVVWVGPTGLPYGSSPWRDYGMPWALSMIVAVSLSLLLVHLSVRRFEKSYLRD